MRRTIAVSLILTITLAGCGTVRDSRLNPFNWFGRASQAPVETTATNPLIPQRSPMSLRRDPPYAGQPVQQLTGLFIERVPGGAVIRVEGLSARQGAHDVRVVPDVTGSRDENGVVDGVMSFQVMAERSGSPVVGPEATRRVVAARHVSDAELRDVRVIRVAGATNVLTSRR